MKIISVFLCMHMLLFLNSCIQKKPFIQRDKLSIPLTQKHKPYRDYLLTLCEKYELGFNKDKIANILLMDFTRIRDTVDVSNPSKLIRYFFQYYKPVSHAFGSLHDYSFDESISNRNGVCLTLSIILLCYFEEFNIDAWVVNLGTHSFVRYKDTEGHLHNIEVTEKGKEYQDSYYIEVLRFPFTLKEIEHKGIREFEGNEIVLTWIAQRIYYCWQNIKYQKDQCLKLTNKYQEQLNKISDANKGKIEGFKLLAFIYQDFLNAPDKAVEIYNKILTAKEDEWDVICRLILLLVQEKQTKKCIGFVQKLKQRKVNDPLIYLALSEYYSLVKDFKTALKYNSEGIMHCQKYQDKEMISALLRARFVIYLRSNRWEKAEECFQKGIKLYPPNAYKYYLTRAETYYDLGEYKKGLSEIERIIKLYGENEYVKNLYDNMKLGMAQ